jgi:Ser/Thr protein kinase RdoA (MazF antagonist)
VLRRSRRSPAAIDWELDLIEHLRANDVGVPAINPTLDGERRHGDLLMLSWIDGLAPVTEGDWRMVANELRRIHHVTNNWAQRPTFRTTQALLTHDEGGDVDLSLMPDEMVALCRRAWRYISDEPTSAIHGDPRGNVLIASSRVFFIDWDEARADASILDLVDLPFSDAFIDERRLDRAKRAAAAWEAAAAWSIEPEYARRRFAELS